MNKTAIEWCDMTWNPVSGCYHNCDYCYARKIATRFKAGYVVGENDKYILSDEAAKYIVTPETVDGKTLLVQHKPLFKNTGIRNWKDGHYAGYPFGFCPTLHERRLTEPSQMKKSQRIFVCSMADLFGVWVPDEWIHEVFAACEAAPQHTYMFLTKNPRRYCELANAGNLPKNKNYWWGSTVTNRESRRYPGRILDNTFLSIEPLQEYLNAGIGSFGGDKLIIIGSETGCRKDKIVPDKNWITNICEAAALTHAAVFMKESLRQLMGSDFVQEWPAELKGMV